jgi:sulfoxide reductase catalytic subunit YedY
MVLSGLGAFGLAIRGFLPLDKAWSAIKRLLPKGTDLKTLINENPALLNARDLELQPLEKFETMGLSDQAVDLKAWRLVCSGQISTELRLTYDQIRALPSLERPVLLICPGFFANYGRWKGISLAELGKKTGVKKGVNFVTISGPEGPYEKTARFPWKDVDSGKIFLAYQVNGEPLPVKHGYPLRLVAEGVYGTDWVKYVYKVQFDKIDKA